MTELDSGVIYIKRCEICNRDTLWLREVEKAGFCYPCEIMKDQRRLVEENAALRAGLSQLRQRVSPATEPCCCPDFCTYHARANFDALKFQNETVRKRILDHREKCEKEGREGCCVWEFHEILSTPKENRNPVIAATTEATCSCGYAPATCQIHHPGAV